jgi:probable HAF family extracellular repeat protein
MIDLNSLIPENAGWTLSDAQAINDRGQIVGTARFTQTGTLRAFRFTFPGPADEFGVMEELGLVNSSTDTLARFTDINNFGECVGESTNSSSGGTTGSYFSSVVGMIGLPRSGYFMAVAEENVSPDADFTAREITQALFKARPDAAPKSTPTTMCFGGHG